MQARVGVDELFVQPAIGARGVGARTDDCLERGVDANVEMPARTPQRSADMQASEPDHATRVGRPPRDRAPALDSHREHPAPVRREQRSRFQVSTEADDIVVGLSRIWERPTTGRRFSWRARRR
jgi:hypothetical protein